MLTPPPAVKSAIDAVRAFAGRHAVRRALRIIQFAILAGVIVYLIARLSRVGWGEVAGNLPATPLFYLIFALRYFTLPLSEIPAYEIVWKRRLWPRFSTFLRKRVYNFAVMGYSGEAFFTIWARRTLDLSDREILAGVKDNNLISALASNIATALLVVALFFTGRLRDELDALPGSFLLFGLAFASAFGLTVAVIVFRRKIISLPPGVMQRLAAIHGGRIALIMALQVLLYRAAIPEPALSAWFLFVALQLVLSRIPFAPNIDIVFLTAAIHLGDAIGVADAEIAGMLVAEAGLSQLFNFILFAATTHLALEPQRVAVAPAGEPRENGPQPARSRIAP
jgi:hypothetical protein